MIKDLSMGEIRPFTVENNITIRELNEKYCQAIGSFGKYQFKFKANVLNYDSKLSDYKIRNESYITCIANSGTHICPYGCKRQIPDEYKGCTELLKDKPNYFDYLVK